VLTAMCDTLDWEVGLFWEVDASAKVLRCRHVVHPTGDTSTPGSDTSIARGRGLVGEVWASGRADSSTNGFDTHPVYSGTALARQLRTGLAFPVRGSAGTLGVFEFASRALEIPSSELVRTVAIIGNHISQFSDRFRAEQALRESDAQKTAILSNALDGIITVDRGGLVVELNAEAERTFLCEPQAMLGRHLAEFVVEADDRVKVETALAALARPERGSDSIGRRLQVRASRGEEEFPVDLAITRIPLDGPPHFSICVRDLSEQERLRDALHHAQKMESLGLLASEIAHDFNNFLTVIRGQAERLVKNLTEDDQRQKWVKSILKVSERASALTGQLLAFGRREAVKVAVVDLNAIIESTAGLLSQQLGDSILWTTNLSPRTGSARVGAGQVQQILFNLALNARDAMPDGGTLHVETGNVDLSQTDARRLLLPLGPYVRLSVKDTGRGMDARTQSRVFEPFFTTKKLGAGTGLGLSTVYAIVQQSGGQISVTSRLGAGTTFEVYFPRVSGNPTAGPDVHGHSADESLAHLTVLLVEDEDEIREIIGDTLRDRGCQVLEARNGLAALERCTTHEGPIHLLLTDMMMPGMNGHQLAERFVRLRPETPVMFVSGHPEADVGDNTLIGRNVTLLRKPFSSDELVDRVVQITD
jgi:PAS domain S-box-containing protein